MSFLKKKLTFRQYYSPASGDVLLLSRLNEFLRFNADNCFILDYGRGPIPFKSLERIYGKWYFAAIETNLKIKVFYFRGSKEKFEKRCNDLLETICEQYFRISSECGKVNLRTLGYMPSLLTADFSQNEFADAIRKDFLRFGQYSYDTGDNILGQVCNRLNYFDVSEFKRAKWLSFDFQKWFLKEREKTIEDLRKKTEDLL